MKTVDETVYLLRQEVVQRREEGYDVEAMAERVEDALKNTDELQKPLLVSILDEFNNLKPSKSFPYTEPSTLNEIRAERPEGPRRLNVNLTDDRMLDRIHGAWLGRAAGCALGKPVEGWQKERIDSYLQFTKALPLDDYFPLADNHPDGLVLRMEDCSRGRIQYMARDDDMDYTVLGLHILEQHGAEFTSQNVANTWLSRLPYYFVYTAERIAYRNLVNGLWPPESAAYRNPYREWIGAQIRADIWGYVCPGWPERAAELAYRDAAVSHVKNGIYGEMFVAAMLAASFVIDDVEEVIRIGLSEIPANCRLAEAIRNTVQWCKESSDWEQVWNKINENYGHYHGVHTINNAALVVMGLMFGQRDYETSIVVSVRGGWDTDCNGATAGSICGMMLGADALPSKWVGVLNDRLLSAVRGFSESRISDLAKRSHEIARKVMAENG